MPLRARRKLGPFTVTPKGASLRVGGRRAGVTASRRGLGIGVRLLPGVTWYKRLRRTTRGDK